MPLMLKMKMLFLVMLLFSQQLITVVQDGTKRDYKVNIFYLSKVGLLGNHTLNVCTMQIQCFVLATF